MLEEYIRNFILIIAREWTEKSSGSFICFLSLIEFFYHDYIVFIKKKTAG